MSRTGLLFGANFEDGETERGNLAEGLQPCPRIQWQSLLNTARTRAAQTSISVAGFNRIDITMQLRLSILETQNHAAKISAMGESAASPTTAVCLSWPTE